MITIEYAREIAAQWQSPGSHGKRFAEFASCATISDPEGLMSDIDREIRMEKTEGGKVLLNQLKEFLTIWLDED